MTLLKNDLEDIFGRKGCNYDDLLSKIEIEGISYKILNLFKYQEPGSKVPGDLDILLPINSKHLINKLFIKLGFFKYIESNTNQSQWLKYIDGVGIIQVHAHFDMSFYFKKILSINEFKSNGNNLSLEENFFIFILQSFFKFSYGVKSKKKYEYLIKKVSLEKVKKNFSFVDDDVKKIFYYSLNIFEKDSNPSALRLRLNLFRFLPWGASKFLTIKLFNKLKKLLFHRNDLKIVFMGVDGAGKSTLIDGLRDSFSSEVLNECLYFGLKNSFFYNLKNKLSTTSAVESNKTDVERANLKSNSVNKNMSMKELIGFSYFLEYNYRLFKSCVINHSMPSKVFLLDRSYFDCLLYYKSDLLKWFFFYCTFKPTLVVFLTGDAEVLYERKKEIPLGLIKENISKYTTLVSKLNSNGFKTLSIDTTKQDKDEILNFLLIKIFCILKSNNLS